jgi:glutamine amidotransferase
MIGIVNYGVGNVQAIANIYKRLNIPARLVDSPVQLAESTKLVLPGVGAFDWAMDRLNRSGLRAELDRRVLVERIPVLGICVGMQMMAARSDEGVLPGLNWIAGDVRRFDESRFSGRTHLPHMGWNEVVPSSMDCLFRGIESGSRFYFLHSYFFAPANQGETLSTTDYYGPYTSTVKRARIFGTQFHPEKSHHVGVKVLSNFSEL